jgi:8-oxo-dGTP pyrophosphatase MutT (NUDIX family)
MASMSPPDLRSHLRRRLEQEPAPVPGPGDRLAAVLALIVGDVDPAIVFTERSAGLRRHGGEMSFPGGLQEPSDISLAATALRESMEEIGLDPATPDVLGALPAVHTFVSGILVVPFVGVVDRLPELAPADGEIARILTIPVAELAGAEREVTWVRPGADPWTGWVYEVEGATIWGVTGRMLHELLSVVRGVPA